MRYRYITAVLVLIQASSALANPVISEFMADNETTIADENGDFSDWVEIHNPAATAISLQDWYLTDNASNLTKWRFPATTIEPGGFILVWASSKNRRTPGAALHTNFALSKDGEFLALVRPDGVTVEQSFAPKFPAQAGDESYGARFQSTVLLAAGASGKYKIPTSSSDPLSTWNTASFSDSGWAAGTGGFGFGIEIPGITIKQVSKNGGIAGLDDAVYLTTLSMGDPSVLATATTVSPVVNLLGDGPDGHYPFSSVPPGGGGDQYAILATGNLHIPTAGNHTFGLHSDDGGRIVIDGVEVMRDDSFHSPKDTLGSTFLTAGQHTFEVVMFDGGGGDCLEFYAAAGIHSSFDGSAFHLVGDVANGGLAATTLPPGGGGLVGTNLKIEMTGKAGAFLRMPFLATGQGNATAFSLVMRYNDGFSAWLNGTPVASDNAPASPAWNSTALAARAADKTLRRAAFNLRPYFSSLANGQNTLAIHGMNSSTSDPGFLVLPELIAGRLDTSLSPASYGEGLATPGWINGLPSSLGNVASMIFSKNRGIFTSPFSLTIATSTPDAVIRYTLDGSTPGETNGVIYTAPLTISGTTVVRAIATLTGWKSTAVETQSFLFPDDVITQSADGSAPPGWPSTSGTSQVLDQGMDPDIINHPNPEVGGVPTVKSALLALPSLLITSDLPNLLNIGGSQGIYSNPNNRGFAWERPASMEWIDPPDEANPNGTSAFQINAGMRIRGGYSRSTDNPKHAMRFLFREEYGDTKLRYPLFGRDAAQEFDKIDLRTSQNYSWSFGGDSRNTFLREESSRQAQLDMGHPGSHVRYVHLYLNGRYWGLYDLDERTEAAFAASYIGGDKDDYDVVKSEADAGYSTAPTDGNLTAWLDLFTKAKQHRGNPSNENYFRMMGTAPDGVTPTADPVLLDPVNLVDYMLLTFWTGNQDGCVSSFLNNERANNWAGARRRVGNPRQGFQFFVHDFEHSMLDVNDDRTGPFTSTPESNPDYYNPMFIHQDLIGNTEYKMLWADRIHRHLFNGGALTPGAWQNRVNRFAAIIDPAIAAESARWGDANPSVLRTRLDWISAQNSLISYLTPRNPVVLNQLRADGLYPSLDAPILSPYGGYQPEGVEIAIQGSPDGTIHYMADGSDPRAVGGALRSGALTYTAANTTAALIPWSAPDWKYLADGSNLGTAWRQPSYDATTWPSGTAELGFGDGDEATVIPIVDISPGIAGIQKPATTYFRKTFPVSNPAQITGLSLTIEYDDSHAVYLNGTRVAGNLPNNPDYSYYTGNPGEDTIETVSIPAGLLMEGENTISVESHQANDGSSDLSLNLSLIATRTSTATPLTLQGIGKRTLRFRAKVGSVWSALSEATYMVGTAAPTPANLVVSEISYFPRPPDGDSEFIELLNTGAIALDLSGARFTEGIDFTFADGYTLAAGARVIIVKNIGAFQAVHGTGKPIAGAFLNDSALSNTGEHLRLESANGNVLLDFSYGVGFPWPAFTNGLGRSMILTNTADPANPASWRPSSGENGNPGTSDSFTRLPGQSLLEYATARPSPVLDHMGNFSITRRLGADDVTLTPEWSSDLREWHPGSFTPQPEIPVTGGNSVLTWKLDPLPPGRTFVRVRVVEQR